MREWNGNHYVRFFTAHQICYLQNTYSVFTYQVYLVIHFYFKKEASDADGVISVLEILVLHSVPALNQMSFAFFLLCVYYFIINKKVAKSGCGRTASHLVVRLSRSLRRKVPTTGNHIPWRWWYFDPGRNLLTQNSTQLSFSKSCTHVRACSYGYSLRYQNVTPLTPHFLLHILTANFPFLISCSHRKISKRQK